MPEWNFAKIALSQSVKNPNSYGRVFAAAAQLVHVRHHGRLVDALAAVGSRHVRNRGCPGTGGSRLLVDRSRSPDRLIIAETLPTSHGGQSYGRSIPTSRRVLGRQYRRRKGRKFDGMRAATKKLCIQKSAAGGISARRASGARRNISRHLLAAADVEISRPSDLMVAMLISVFAASTLSASAAE
jgi:hypothetical protein